MVNYILDYLTHQSSHFPSKWTRTSQPPLSYAIAFSVTYSRLRNHISREESPAKFTSIESPTIPRNVWVCIHTHLHRMYAIVGYIHIYRTVKPEMLEFGEELEVRNSQMYVCMIDNVCR